MALKKLVLSTSQVTGLSTTQVAGFFGIQMLSSLSAADLASFNQAVIDDQQIVSSLKGTPNAATLQSGFVFTATTTDAGTSMTSVSISAPSGGVIGSIRPNMYIAGPGITPGTRVFSAASTTITMDRAAISGKTTGSFICTPAPLSGGLVNGFLTIPNRGTLKVLPGDVVFIDINGFPYLAPATSLAATPTGAPFIFT